MKDSALLSTNIPDHIPADLVVDFDFINLPGAKEDIHLAWKKLHDGPDIFWTPHYGGHWVATRADAIEEIELDHERFSHRSITIPSAAKRLPTPPLNTDPPDHHAYRVMINRAFSPKAVKELEVKVRQVAIDLIEGFKADGECEFVSQFAKHLPIVIILGMLDLPWDRREQFLEWSETVVRASDVAERQSAYANIHDYLRGVIRERTANPGEDIISQIILGTINGRPYTEEETLAMSSLLFVGGLDTVAGMLSFIARFLATHPEHRRRLIAEPGIRRQAIEELLRRHALPSTARYITHDFEFHGVQLKKGEMIQIPTTLHGLDERRWENPLEVDFDRSPCNHATFGNGPHRCPGANLAKVEISVFLDEWLARIPDFEIKPGHKPVTTGGMVNGMVYLPLVWQV